MDNPAIRKNLHQYLEHMTSTTIWLLARWGVGLILGAILVRRFRTPIRAAIGYCFPMKQRMNPNFFSRIQKYTAVATISLALLFAIVTNLAYLRWVQPQIETEYQMTILPPPPVFEEKPTLLEAPISTTTQTENNNTLTEVTPKPKPSSPPVPVKNTPVPASYEFTNSSIPAYLQLGAFQEFANAQRLKTAWKNRSPYSTFLATLPDDTPYKVLLGPFPNLDAARRFRHQYQLSAFPRPASHYPSIQH